MAKKVQLVDYSPVQPDRFDIDFRKTRYVPEDVLSQYLIDEDTTDQTDSTESMPPPPPPTATSTPIAKRQRTSEDGEWKKPPTGVLSTYVNDPVQKLIERETKRTGKEWRVSTSPPPFKSSFNLLTGELAAIMETDEGERMPIIVKRAYQSNDGEVKSLPELIVARQPYHYLEVYDETDGIFIIRKYSKVWYDAIGVMARTGTTTCWLVTYSDRDGSILPTKVQMDEGAFKRAIKDLGELVVGKKE